MNSVKSMNRSYTEEEIARLRKLYSLDKDGNILFDLKLLQQDEISVFVVWLQALIDTNSLKGYSLLQVIQQLVNGDNDLLSFLIQEYKNAHSSINEKFMQQAEKIKDIELPISCGYIVVPSRDLDYYRKIFELLPTDKRPKGIIVYESSKVIYSNFATPYKGDHKELSNFFNDLLNAGLSINYEEDMLGFTMDDSKMTGHRKHVIGENFISKRKSIVMSDNGDVIIVE